MSVERIGVFLIIEDGRTGAIQYRFFNSMARGDNGQPVTRYDTAVIEGSNQTYSYIPFIYAGGRSNRMGDNLTASLQLAPNEVSMAYAADMVEMVDRNTDAERMPMVVRAITVTLSAQDWKPVRALTDETWIAAGMTYTSEVLEIFLSSAIDAVNALTPSYSLNRVNVGRVPITANVRA